MRRLDFFYSMARALAVAPDVLLLDEPLSALDPNFREEIRGLLRRLHHETGITALMVTHDFAEAHFLATRTAVIGAGRIEQIGPVAEVFNRPISTAVAAFVGMKNIFEVRFDGGVARAGALTFFLAGPVDPTWRFMAVRPEDVRVHGASPATRDGALNLFSGRVTRIDHQGVFADVQVRCSGLLWQALLPTSRLLDEGVAEGRAVWLEVPAGKIHLM